MGIIETIGILLGVMGILFAFETPRRWFLRLLRIRQQGSSSAPTIPELRKSQANELARLIAEAQNLALRSREVPIAAEEHNEWAQRVAQYLRDNLGESYVVRFSDFSGMTFYGDASERSKLRIALEGRTRRLHEFIKELNG